MSNITPIGKANWRNSNQIFGIKDNDRFGHIYAIGKTGVGKSTLLLNMAISDIQRGNGLAVIDPHGDLATTLLGYIPKERITDVLYLNPADSEYPIPFNPLIGIPEEQHNLAVAGLIGAFKRIWAENWGPRLEHILRYTLLSLLEYGNSTLLDIHPMLTNEIFRTAILDRVHTKQVRAFWNNEFDRYPPQLKSEAIAPILNKMGLFNASAALRNTIGQHSMTWDMQAVMDKRKIFIANLSKGLIGEDASTLLGNMLVTAFHVAGLRRASVEEHDRVPFYIYIDEAHSFMTHSLADVLAEARKFKLSLFLTHQYLEQLPENIRAAIFGNVGTLICFRVGATDALALAKEFFPVFKEQDLLALPTHAIYLKLMIDGMTSRPFSATTLSLPANRFFLHQQTMEYSRQQYGRKVQQDDTQTVSMNKQRQKTLFQ